MRYFELTQRVGSSAKFIYCTIRDIERKLLPGMELLEITKEAYLAGIRSLSSDGLKPGRIYPR